MCAFADIMSPATLQISRAIMNDPAKTLVSLEGPQGLTRFKRVKQFHASVTTEESKLDVFDRVYSTAVMAQRGSAQQGTAQHGTARVVVFLNTQQQVCSVPHRAKLLHHIMMQDVIDCINHATQSSPKENMYGCFVSCTRVQSRPCASFADACRTACQMKSKL